MKIAKLYAIGLMWGGVALLCPTIYTDAGQAKNHVNQQVAVLSRSGQVQVSTAKSTLREIFDHFQYLDSSAKSSFVEKFKDIFDSIDFLGKVLIARELEKTNLSYTDSDLLNDVMQDVICMMSARDQRRFDDQRRRGLNEEIVAEKNLAQAELADERIQRSIRNTGHVSGGACAAGGLIGSACCTGNPVVIGLACVGGLLVGEVGGRTYRYTRQDAVDARTALSNAKKKIQSIKDCSGIENTMISLR